MKRLTPEQHRALEKLTGQQHTRTGQVRKRQNRDILHTYDLGLMPWLPPGLDWRNNPMHQHRIMMTPLDPEELYASYAHQASEAAMDAARRTQLIFATDPDYAPGAVYNPPPTKSLDTKQGKLLEILLNQKEK